MKLLITNTKYEGGGAESSIRNLMSFAKNHNVDISLITQDYYRRNHKNKIRSWIAYFFEIRKLAQDYDCVISGIEGINYLLTRFACVGLNIKIIQWIHCNPIDYLKYQNFKNKIALKLALRLSKDNLYASPYYFEKFGRNGIFMPNFICLPIKNIENRRKNIVFYYVGSLSVLKRPQLALKAIDLFPSSELVFFGDGVLYSDLKKIVDENIRYKNVSFRGYINDPWHDINTGGVILLPSETEALPMIVVEAINNKCAIIINKFKGYDFFAVNNGLVLPVDFENSDELRDLIHTVSNWTDEDWSDKYEVSKEHLDKIFNNYKNLSKLISYIDGMVV